MESEEVRAHEVHKGEFAMYNLMENVSLQEQSSLFSWIQHEKTALKIFFFRGEIWVLTLKFLGSLAENRISSDLITYGSLLSGLQRTAQWRRAIHMALDQQNMITCEILANATRKQKMRSQ